ncbi:hypothetical protein HanIR_Chr09g0435201 [Helianthus annuus]|nr:hypothetical protein HanIR_Chr09g0435201 [Helianthus annuus]
MAILGNFVNGRVLNQLDNRPVPKFKRFSLSLSLQTHLGNPNSYKK